MPGRVARWAVAAALVAGCAASGHSGRPPTSGSPDQTDVWFAQHMIPHLWQQASIAFLSQDRLRHPALIRLAATIGRHGQAAIQPLQQLLARRGLAPHGHSHQRVDNRRGTDLERLAQLRGTALDIAFLEVMTDRDRAGISLAATEATQGSVPDVRELARRMVAELRARIRQMTTWKRAWAAAARR